MTRRIRLGELLVRAGVIDEVRLRAALAHQQKWGGRLGTVLVDLGFVSEDLLVKALSKQLGIARANFDLPRPPAAVLQKVGAEFAQEHNICPVFFDATTRTLTVATADPTNVAALDQLRFKTGYRIETVIAAASEIARLVPTVVGSGLTLDVGPREIDISGTPEMPDGLMVLTPSDDLGQQLVPPQADIPTAKQAAALPKPWSPVPPPDSLPPTPPAAAPPPRTASPPARSASPPVRAPAAAPPPTETQAAMVQRVQAAQRQQQKALRVLFEMLVERGVMTAEEFTARIQAL